VKNIELLLPKGYQLRAAQPGDIKHVTALENQFSKHYLGFEDSQEEDIKNGWESPGFDPEQDVRLVFTPEGKLAGFVEIWMTSHPPVHPWVWLRLHPDYMHSGLGETLLQWAEERARDAFDLVPEEARISMRTGTVSTIHDMKGILENHGMTLFRHAFRMIIEMDSQPGAPAWPEGITLVPYNPDQDSEAVFRAASEAFQDHFGYVEQPFEEEYPRFMHFMTGTDMYDPEMWFIAMDGDQIAGICLCSRYAHEDHDSGYINSLSVRRPWRKRGIATALLEHAFREYYQRGKSKVMLGVDASNLTGALSLYEKVGMRVLRRFDQYEKELRAGVEISRENL
jgi:ribosomal protein S18 acetylase RimI-like enzyme